ncbi:MAG: hypothetical protein AAGC55_30740, partial [Myxococcota bacterium]
MERYTDFGREPGQHRSVARCIGLAICLIPWLALASACGGDDGPGGSAGPGDADSGDPGGSDSPDAADHDGDAGQTDGSDGGVAGDAGPDDPSDAAPDSDGSEDPDAMEPPVLDACFLSCITAAECSQGTPAFDADNYQCQGGVCRYIGCVSDDECAATYLDPSYVCATLPGQDFATCQRSCTTVGDCTQPSPLFDSDNYACTDV